MIIPPTIIVTTDSIIAASLVLTQFVPVLLDHTRMDDGLEMI